MKLTKQAKEFFATDLNKSKFCVATEMSRGTLRMRLATPGMFKALEIIKLKELTGLSFVEIFSL